MYRIVQNWANLFLLSSLFYIRKYLNSENFQLSVFDGFTRFENNTISLFVRKVCLTVCMCHKLCEHASAKTNGCHIYLLNLNINWC